MQALVKARGDGLGFELRRAEFTAAETEAGWLATVAIDGRPKARCDTALLARKVLCNDRMADTKALNLVQASSLLLQCPRLAELNIRLRKAFSL